MTSEVRLSQDLPTSLHDWELTLSRALLRADGGDSDAIRSFEITPETLAMHSGVGIEHAEAAEAAFRRALRNDPHLIWCLQHGTWKVPSDEQPNCMALLALTLLVDSLLDGVYVNKGQYRAKLAEWLGIERSFMDLRGIATMWAELVAWLDQRVAAGAPFRRLILPDIPVSWTQIGYTRYLSFPTKRDIRLLTKAIGCSSGASLDPAKLIYQLDPIVQSATASHGLKAAFKDFRNALRSGAASVDHRFWRLATRVRDQVGQAAPAVGSLVMDFDEDGLRRFHVAGADAVASAPALLGSAVAAPVVAESSNLGPTIRRGVLFFRSSGMARWTAAGEPPPGNGPFHLAIASRHFERARGAIAEFVASGSWVVTMQPIPAGTITDILRRIGIADAKLTVRTIALVDGIRVGAAWLGQPRYLPYLEGASGSVVVSPLFGAAEGGVRWANGDLVATAPIDGQFAIADAAAHWSRRTAFKSLADVHADLDCAALKLPEQCEWALRGGALRDTSSTAVEGWNDAPYAYQDVVEALYASSRAGASEGDAVQIIGRAAGRSSWEMLRTLQESTFLDARPRERWKGRVFTLGRPRLTAIRTACGPVVLVAGAIPSRLEVDFRATVSMQGGTPHRALDEDGFSPPLHAASGIDPLSLAEALGWPIDAGPGRVEGTVGSRLVETSVSGDGYLPSSRWDWSAGRFRVGPDESGPVALVRLAHPGGRDHDVYRVHGRIVRSFHSRHAAILDAHFQAGRPLFRFEQGRIVRLTAEGALPLEIAAELRVRSMRNVGSSARGWSYAASTADAMWLAALLPNCIEGVQVGSTGALPMSHLRGRGDRRLLWLGGGIAA